MISNETQRRHKNDICINHLSRCTRINSLQPDVQGEKIKQLPVIPICFGSPEFIFPSDPNQLNDIEQIIQRVGTVPELVLAPEAGGHGKEGQLVEVRGLGGEKGGRRAQEGCPPAGKKSSSVQARTSWVRR